MNCNFSEAVLVENILRHWSREKIVRFAKHLLGDVCQECPQHDNEIDQETTDLSANDSQ